jgi:hypothetical protein
MKKSIFVFSLLLPLSGFAQGVDTLAVRRFMGNPLGLVAVPSGELLEVVGEEVVEEEIVIYGSSQVSSFFPWVK